MTARYLEDFEVGQVYASGKARIDAARIKSFAAEFDPQPFHLDESTAKETFFQGLAASGWHTAAVTMRLITESGLNPQGGIIGGGCDEMRWPRAVRPGDELRVENEVIGVTRSRSRPDRGLVRLRTTTFNQDDQPVQVMISNLVVPARKE